MRSHARRRFSPVPYYLCCRALELGLKAFLLARGLSKAELRKHALGHNLLAVLALCRRQGLESLVKLGARHGAEIAKANSYYAGKGFEYFEVLRAVRGYRDLPDLAVLTDACVRLLDGLESECLNAA